MLRNLLVVIVFGTAALVGVWDLLQIEAFDNALVQFATAGVVPGTHHALSPGQVYITLCVILLLAICLLFRKAIVRDWREFRAAFRHAAARPAVQQTPPQPALTVPAAVPIEPVIEAVLQPQSQPKPQPDRPAVIITIPGTPGLLHKWAGAVAAGYRPAAARVWRYVVIRSRQDARSLRSLLIRISTAVGRAAVRAWRYTEPRIRTLDARIERYVKRYPVAAHTIREGERLYKITHDRMSGWRTKALRQVGK